MKREYEFFPHTADAKFRASGRTLEEAFAAAAGAMTSVMTDPAKVKKRLVKRISASGADEKSLLYNFLEEILFLLDSEGFLLSDVLSIRINGLELSAELAGDKASSKYRTAGDVKAVTYNEMEIRRAEGKVTVQIVLDL